MVLSTKRSAIAMQETKPVETNKGMGGFTSSLPLSASNET
jgi:hypothetical protein